MTTVTLEEAQARLPELIAGLTATRDEIVIITDGNQQPVARLSGPPTPRVPGTMAGTVLYMAPDFDAPLDGSLKAERTSWPCQPGSAAGQVWMAPDFDAPLDDFKEYME
jgi:antitoxin (DNA-binding transcriptional repressor) of toxin-antitoxin stability system